MLLRQWRRDGAGLLNSKLIFPEVFDTVTTVRTIRLRTNETSQTFTHLFVLTPPLIHSQIS